MRSLDPPRSGAHFHEVSNERASLDESLKDHRHGDRCTGDGRDASSMTGASHHERMVIADRMIRA